MPRYQRELDNRMDTCIDIGPFVKLDGLASHMDSLFIFILMGYSMSYSFRYPVAATN